MAEFHTWRTGKFCERRPHSRGN